MKIAVDAMGGDFAPHEVVKGAYLAATEDGTSVALVGDRETIQSELAELGDESDRIEVVHALEVVGMDEPAITPLRKKRDSSIRVAAEMVRDGRAKVS